MSWIYMHWYCVILIIFGIEMVPLLIGSIRNQQREILEQRRPYLGIKSQDLYTSLNPPFDVWRLMLVLVRKNVLEPLLGSLITSHSQLMLINEKCLGCFMNAINDLFWMFWLILYLLMNIGWEGICWNKMTIWW